MSTTFVLIPGAGGMALYWRDVAPLLEAAGRRAIAVDIPGDDESLGLDDYADLVATAIGDHADVTLVAHSLGGFTAPLVCALKPVRALILVDAMIPAPGETPGAWWGATGAVEARVEAARAGGYPAEFDLESYFLHDIPEATLRGLPPPREQSAAIFASPCRFARWPAIPTHVIASAGDRFFPLDFQRRVARERLGREVETLPGGHLVALANPGGLADLLLKCAEVASSAGIG